MNDLPNCWKCRFFRISWDARFPYECDAMKFKSQALPCVQVMTIDGRECQSFRFKSETDLDDNANEKPSGIKGNQIDQSA